MLNLSAALLLVASFILRAKRSRIVGLVTAALGEVVMTIATQLGGKMVYQYSVCVDRTDRHVFPEPLVPVTSRLWTRE